MGLEIGADDVVAGEVECTGYGEAFGHADAGDEDGSRAEGGGAPDKAAGGG